VDGAISRYEHTRAVSTDPEVITNLGYFIRFVAIELDHSDAPAMVDSPQLEVASDVVERALRDVERLLITQGAVSSVDRIHAAFHGYLRALLSGAEIAFLQEASITALFKMLREQHPSLREPRARSGDIDKILRAAAVIVDALNPVRNHATVAHPNEELLEDPEAMLVVNRVRTLLHYLNARTRAIVTTACSL
jgi:hypothetical protein